MLHEGPCSYLQTVIKFCIIATNFILVQMYKKRDLDNFLDRVSLQCFVWPVENSAALVHKGLWHQD